MKPLLACPSCGHTNPGGSLFCAKCNARFPGADDSETIGATLAASSLGDTSQTGTPLPPLMERGTVLAGGRYEILNLLGQGAMGAVYKAKDRELDRWVAIKVIQPELVGSRAMVKRFKQELILARQITHKNVVRIFDIGETDGMKFITMEYIDGGDLKSLIVERGKLPPEEAVNIIRQICHALDAAHSEGVVHRDLKPQNIMMDHTGRVVVMDFGIAHSNDLPGMTMTGALVGTPEYMSPEQAKGEKTDLRADIFAVGIIFYEMLTGNIPFKAATVVETMYKRTREGPVPPIEVDASIPLQANQVIMKCLESRVENRYQNVGEILRDLEVFDPEKKAGPLHRIRLSASRRWKSVAVFGGILSAVLIAVLAGFLIRDRIRPKAPAAHAPLNVFIADFNNHTGDALFDGALEPVVKMALESAGFINVYDRTQMRNLGLPPVSGKLDEAAARKIAVGQGLGVVISGSLDRQADGYALSLKATEAVTGNNLGIADDAASKKDQVLFAATKLAGTIRKSLGDETSDSAQRFAMETLSAASLEAVHEYATAMNGLADGKQEDALRSFSKAVDIDQNFGLAYAGMAIASRNMGQQQDAEKYVKIALGHIDRMTERERYRTRGLYYLILDNPQKCVEEYGTLVSRFPSDAAAHNNLALCWSDLHNLPKALEEQHLAADILPKRSLYRANASLYASWGSNFEAAEQETRTAQELDPASRPTLLAVAFNEMAHGRMTEAAETFQKLEKVSKAGASDARLGLADIALYEGRFADALRILDQGIGEDLAAKSSDRAAEKFAALAYVRLTLGDKRGAAVAAESALANSKILKVRFLTGRIFAAAGQASRAQTLAAGLAAEVKAEPQAYAKLLGGEIALASGDPRGAVKAITEANNLMDTWIGRFDLGRAYLEAGAFAEADSEFDRCIKRRGEALALFIDPSPTYGYFPPVYYYAGRVREGLKSAGFAESYRTYLGIRGKAGEDPLLSEVRKRAGQ